MGEWGRKGHTYIHAVRQDGGFLGNREIYKGKCFREMINEHGVGRLRHIYRIVSDRAIVALVGMVALWWLYDGFLGLM